MNCSTKCIKWCFFVFNLLWMASAVFGLKDTIHLLTLEGVSITLHPEFIAFIILPVITLAVAILGCFGAIKENRRMVIIYTAFLMIIFVVDLAFAIKGFVSVVRYYNEHMREQIDSRLSDFDNYWTDYSARASINHLQSTELCCGSTGPSYWDNFNDKKIPRSCCGSDYESLTCTKSTAFTTGCVTMLHTGFYRLFAPFIGFNIGLLVVELGCFVFALILAKPIRNIHQRGTINSAEMTRLS